MTELSLSDIYKAYIDCLNRRAWNELGRYVHIDVCHNASELGLSGYQAMLEAAYRAIPDLHFAIELLVCEPPHVAARLNFDCTPTGRFLELPVDGRAISFAENVFYRFQQQKIISVWSVLDKLHVEAQLSRRA